MPAGKYKKIEDYLLCLSQQFHEEISLLFGFNYLVQG